MARLKLISDNGDSIIESIVNNNNVQVLLNGENFVIGSIKVEDTESTTAELNLSPGHFYVFDKPLTSLNIKSYKDSGFESIIMFTTAQTGFDVDFPDTIQFFGAPPVFNVNTKYMLILRHGVLGVAVLYKED